MVDYSFKEDFKYKNDNPYNDKLEEFSDFVLRDHDGEAHKGQWNQEVFKREGLLFLEIGTGAGHFMIDYCADHPEENFVGLDYRFKRSFHLAKKLAGLEFKNFRYLRAKVKESNFYLLKTNSMEFSISSLTRGLRLVIIKNDSSKNLF